MLLIRVYYQIMWMELNVCMNYVHLGHRLSPEPVLVLIIDL